MKHLQLPAFVVLASLAACGGGQKKLSKDQRQQVVAVMSSSARANQVGLQIAETQNQSADSKLFSLRHFYLGRISTSSTTVNEFDSITAAVPSAPSNGTGNGKAVAKNTTAADAASPMLTELQDSCDATATMPENDNFGFKSTGPQQWRFEVAGSNCPTEARFVLTVQNTGELNSQNMTTKMRAAYKVKDSKFLDLNDVNSYDLQATVTGQLNGKATTNNIKTSMQLTGFINSQASGKVDLSGSGSFTGSAGSSSVSGDYSVNLKFKDFTAILEVKSTQDSKGITNQEYTLNGERLSNADLKEIFGNTDGMQVNNDGLATTSRQ